jgi:hypothetical protein
MIYTGELASEDFIGLVRTGKISYVHSKCADKAILKKREDQLAAMQGLS